ncbi:proteinase inhibitor PSI-1.2 [Fagus crenata]
MAVPVRALLLVLYGAILLGMNPEEMSAKACPLYCLDVEYMTCQSSGEKKLNPKCNCCLAPKNCTLHLVDGNSVYCNRN